MSADSIVSANKSPLPDDLFRVGWQRGFPEDGDGAARYALPAFVRSGGIVHSLSPTPISLHRRPIASPVRAAISTANSRAPRDAGSCELAKSNRFG